MRGYLYTNIRHIRDKWHVERRVGGRFVVKTFDHEPTNDEIEEAFNK